MSAEGNLPYKDEAYSIIGAAIEVHDILGPGFLESVYESAFVEECKMRDMPIQEQVRMNITYKERPLSTNFIADIVAYGKIIIELKAIKRLTEIIEAQLLNYLKATQMTVGLLINFASHGKLEWKRFAVSSGPDRLELLFI
jgi:GxxExxY protein